MKILHVTLGLPPWRSGGLTYYSLDLMRTQQSLGHDVSLLYPGSMCFGDVRIKRNRQSSNINVFEIINPLPISLTYGMKNPQKYMTKCDINTYKEFLSKYKFDVIHIHTIMGLHKEFFIAIKQLKIKTIFTTHDYFGICLTANLLTKNSQVCENPNGINCEYCCRNGISYNKSLIMQSKLYRVVKSMRFMKRIKQKAKDDMHQENGDINIQPAEDFTSLLDYYNDILLSIDYYHFNSTNTQNIYQKYLDVEGKVLHITIADIIDNRSQHVSTKISGKLKVGYIGTKSAYKGYEWVQHCINQNNSDIEFHLYGSDFIQEESYANVYNHGSYKRSQMKDVFNNIDVLIIPSIWCETFGLVGLESLSFGVPIIVSDKVGIKEIVALYDKKCIIMDMEQLFNSLVRIKDDSQYFELLDNVEKVNVNFSMRKHANDIIDLYRTIKFRGRIA